MTCCDHLPIFVLLLLPVSYRQFLCQDYELSNKQPAGYFISFLFCVIYKPTLLHLTIETASLLISNKRSSGAKISPLRVNPRNLFTLEEITSTAAEVAKSNKKAPFENGAFREGEMEKRLFIFYLLLWNAKRFRFSQLHPYRLLYRL